MEIKDVKNADDLRKLDKKDLSRYAQLLRARIIEVTLENGGHLASNLGITDLAVALHYCFDTPKDKIVWDVGHQTYAHKLITGRWELMGKLRTDEGASGFPSPKESEYDSFTTGHSGTSLSMALGLARARDLVGGNEKVVAVIGDGAFTSGEIYEALNDLGDRPTPMIIILNDNNMSISRNVGAMSKYFNNLRVNRKFVGFKSDFKADLASLPFVGKPLARALTSVKNSVKRRVVGDKFFERFGLKYYGPYDGHNMERILDALAIAKSSQVPVIIHFLTDKGRGYAEAQTDPQKYHGISPKGEKGLSMSAVVGKTLCEVARTSNIAVVTAAMTDGLCLNQFAAEYPQRFFDVAIAEQHAVSLCAGLARGGVKPYFAVYSTFLQRGFDQVLHDVCLNDLPVTFLIDRAGAVGPDGATHQGIFDLSYLSLIPNMAIASPKDGTELAALIKWSATVKTPLAIRYAKSYSRDFGECAPIEFGKWEVLIRADSGVTVLAVGKTNEIAVSLVGATVINARFVLPLDEELLDSLEGTVITLEDNVLHGGFGEAVKNRIGKRCNVVAIGHGNEFCDIRSIDKTYEKSGLTVQNVQKIVNSAVISLENHKNL